MSATRRSPRVNAGYTLIELLIALTLGAFLVGGMMQLYLGSKRSYNTQEALVELQEVGRFTLNSLVTDLRMAGFMGCGSTSNAVNVLTTSASWAYDTATALSGYEGGVSTFPTDIATLVVPGTDAVRLIRAVPSDDYVIQSHNPSAATFQLKSPHDIQQNEILMVTDCLNTSVFQMTNVNNNSTTAQIVHNNGVGTIGNCTKGLGAPLNCASTNGTPYQYDEDAFMMRFMSRIYYIGVGASGRNALFRLSLNNNGTIGTPVEMADGVADMQIVYGVDTDADASVDTYSTADALTAATWGNVLSAQINLLLESETDRIADTPQPYVFYDGSVASLTPVVPTDRQMRRVFSSTVNIRNRTIQ